MYILYFKTPYIVQEPLTKNRTCQTYRNKQIAMCEEEKPLQAYIDRQPKHLQNRFFIEEKPSRD